MATKSDFIVKSGLKVTTDATVTGNVTAAFLSGNGVNITSVDALTVGGNTVSDILSTASGTTDTAYSNAVSYTDTAIGTANTAMAANAATAYSNATSYADTIAGTAYSNATSYADTIAATAYSNATSYADTIAGTAYSNAVSYTDTAIGTANTAMAANAATAYTNAVAYAASNTYVNNTFAPLSGATFTGAVSGTDLTLSGNLTVSGTRTYVNSTTLDVGDNIVTLNADLGASAPSENAGLEVMRGTSANVQLVWNETSDAWTFTNNGSTYYKIASNTDVDTAYSNAVAYAASNTYVNSTFAPLANPTFTGTVTYATLNDGTTALTSTVAELNVLDGITATVTELNYTDGVTSNIQTQLDAKLASSSYTASDVLSKLLTVDGAGSGLDADTLDGISSASFLRSDTADVATGLIRFGGNLSIGSDDDVYLYESSAGAFSVRSGSSGSYNYLTFSAAGALTIGGSTVWHAGNDGSGSGLDADLLDGVQGSSYLRSDAVDYGITLELNGGSTYDPSSTSGGTDTATDVGLALGSGTRIVGHYAGYIRTLFEWNQNSDITIGQSGTTLIGGINLLPGASGDAKVNGNRILTVADEGSGNGLDADTLDGVQGSSYLRSDTSDTFTGTLTVDGTAYIGDSAQRVKIYDDGNAHIHSTSTSLWINAEDGSEIKLNAQYNGNVQIGNGTGYGYAPANLRSPTFYDSGNTTYYINPYATNSSAFYAKVDDTVGEQSLYGIFLDYNGSGSDTLTTDRNHFGMYIDMDVTATGGDTTNEYRAYGQYLDLYNTGTANLLYGQYMYARTAHTSGTVTALGASYNYGLLQGTGTVSSLYGARNNAYVNFTGAQTLSGGYATFNYFYHGASLTGTTTSAFGSYNEIEINSGTITTAYGTRSIIDYNGGTIGTSYLYYGDYQGDPGTKWGVYITGEGGNYFSSNINASGFYDNADTSYYVDPNSTSVMYHINMSGNLTLNGEINMQSSGTKYFDHNGSLYFRYSDNSTFFTNVFRVDSGVYTLSYGSSRAPIFYDSDNTGYYLDGNNTSTMLRLGLYHNADALYFDRAAGNYAYMRWFTSGSVRFDFGIDNTSESGSNAGSNLFINTFSDAGAYIGTAMQVIRSGAYVNFPYSARAAIFYDYNNTAYYVDPNSTSRMYTIECGYNHGIANSIGCSAWFRSSGATGWYNGSYGGGIYMTDTSWVRVYNNKQFYSQNFIQSDTDVRAPRFYDSNDTSVYLDGGTLVLRSTSPTIYFRDTDHYSAMVHNNANLLYILRGAVDTLTWSQVSGQWPAIFNLGNNDFTCGGSIAAIGNITAYASDIRLKENIAEIPNAIEKIKKIRGVTFDWKDIVDEVGFIPDTKHNDLGVIAQEIQEVIPQAVIPAPFDAWVPDPNVKYSDEELAEKTGKSKSGENYLTVNLEKIVPLLIEGIKEQQEQIEALRKEINILKGVN